MHPHTKYRSLATAVAIMVIFIACLGWQGTREIVDGRPAPNTQLGEWVRLHQMRPTRFPIVFMELYRHRSADNRVWDIAVRVERRSRIDYRGHLRVGDKISGTDYTIKDIRYGGSEESENGLTTAHKASTITVTDGEREIILKQNRPELHPDGGVWYELVFFPDTPVRGLGSTFKIQPDKTFQLQYNGRTETYRLTTMADGQAQLQQLSDGSEVGPEIPVKTYAENEHVDWVKTYR